MGESFLYFNMDFSFFENKYIFLTAGKFVLAEAFSVFSNSMPQRFCLEKVFLSLTSVFHCSEAQIIIHWQKKEKKKKLLQSEFTTL